MSTVSRGVLDLIGPESKKTILNLALDVKDLVGKVDLNDSLSKENIVTVELINGKPITKIRIPNNVIIYKDDLKEIPTLLEIIDQGEIRGNSIPLNSFPIEIQNKIIIVFMTHYGYCTRINNDVYFNPHIHDLFPVGWWQKIFTLARKKTLTYIEQEISNGNQPTKNKEIIEQTGLISIKEFRTIEPMPGMDLLWALGIYFFEKVIRNWNDQELPETIYTDTIMDIDLSPGKFIKSLDAKKFFLTQLQIFLGLRPNKIWFGGLYQSKFQELIQKKTNNLNKTIILEELSTFTNFMNLIYSGGNDVLNGSTDSGTEPFAIKNLIYNEVDDGIHTTVNVSIIIQINLYNDMQIYTLPVTTKIN